MRLRQQGIQRLRGLHQVQVEVRLDEKEVEHLVQHLAMLGRDADVDAEAGVGLKGAHQRSELDGLGPGAENEQQ